MKKLFTIISLVVVSNLALAQDPHFSQFFSSPLTLNPAFTGKFDGAVRVMGNYRNQWPSINNAFITSTGAVDFHIFQESLPKNDAWGLGALLLSDKSAAGAVNYNYFSASTAYHKGLDEDGFHQLSLGVQATYASMFINTGDLKFESQLDPNGGGFTLPGPYGGASLSTNYVDINAGLLYSGSTDDRNNFYGGLSLYHINAPKQTFLGTSSYTVKPRFTAQAGGYFAIGPATTLHLSGLETIQGGANETVLGTALQFITNPDDDVQTSVYVGTWLRLKDSFIPYLGLEFNNVRLGASYDINTSSLNTASQKQGGIEISAMYIYRPSTDKPINCPKF